MSLLKDLNEVGTIIGTSNDAMKVHFDIYGRLLKVVQLVLSFLIVLYFTKLKYVFSLLWSEKLELKLSLMCNPLEWQ